MKCLYNRRVFSCGILPTMRRAGVSSNNSDTIFAAETNSENTGAMMMMMSTCALMIRSEMPTTMGAICMQRRGFRKELFEGPLDIKPGERSARKGPPVAHSLPVYKTAHKLNNSVRWKNANLITNVAGGKDYRLRETQGEGTFDESGMYRDWLYGDERRYANYIGVALALLSIGLFLYTMRMMGVETWDIPAPVLASQRRKAAAAVEREESGGSEAGSAADALAMLKKPVIVSKAA